MSTLYIREFSSMAKVKGSNADLAAPQEPAVADQTVTVSGSHAESNAFNDDTRFIAITCDGIFSYQIAVSPVATTSMLRVPAGNIIYLGVKPGMKISAITNT